MEWPLALTEPATLRESGLFVAEGRHVLERVLSGAVGGIGSIVSVLATPAAAQALNLEARLGDRLVTRTPAEMESLTGFNFHRGVLALVRRPADEALDVLIRAAVADRGSRIADRGSRIADRGSRTADRGSRTADRGSRTADRGPRPADRGSATEDRESGNADRECAEPTAVLVVAEHLVDVDNVGSCFRNARAFGAACVLLDERCPDPFYRKAVRTSLGAVLEVPWAQAPMNDILDRLGAAGVVTVGLTPDRGVAAALTEVSGRLDAHVPVALVVGNEGRGLSPETRARCTHLARIPMAGDADSINVATALAVALYEWRTRRR